MMNIIDFVKEFEFKKRRRLRSWGGAKICSGGCEYMLRGVRPDRGAPPETATVNDLSICRSISIHVFMSL